MSEIYDITVIGAGIIGSAVALTILEKHPQVKVLIIDKESESAMHQTGRNSGVIHSGIYYKPGSLKARTCQEGIRLLHEFCARNAVDFEITGKVIVATVKEEIPLLENLYNRGCENKLKGLKLISKEEVLEFEPHVIALKGLHVPITGIINYKKVVDKYIELFKTLGGTVKFNCKLLEVINDNRSIILKTSCGMIKTKNIINCAGLYSDSVASMCGVKLDYRIIPFRGEYYKLKKEKHYLVRNLVYPVPNPEFPFLGVHFTRMLDGDREVGPNAVLALKREGYSKISFSLKEALSTVSYFPFWKMASQYWKMGFNEMYMSFYKKAYVKEINKMIPEITVKDLIPAQAGVRAQALDNTGKLLDDFKVIHNKNMIHVLNAPSPAATASLAIARKIVSIAGERIIAECIS